MKQRIDLHVHTLQTPLDAPFEYSRERLKKHVDDNKLDIIAITNHNLFNLENYRDAERALPNTMILPGVEVSVDGFHCLYITDRANAETLAVKCQKLPEQKQGEPGIPMEMFRELFCDSSGLIIPHYDKEPAVSTEQLKALRGDFVAVETCSKKKWKHLHDEGQFVPVLFSDYRAAKDAEAKKGRYTYVECETEDFRSLKLAIGSAAKVSLASSDNEMEVSPGLTASSKLNVVIGGRSSGKTYLLEQLYNTYGGETAKLIGQFSIVQQAEGKAFDQVIEHESELITARYYLPVKRLYEKINEYPLIADIMETLSLEAKQLKQYSETEQFDDVYSQCPLFSEGLLPVTGLSQQKRVLKAVSILLNENPYSKQIERYVDIESLKLLREDLKTDYRKLVLEQLMTQRANAIKEDIKKMLQNKSRRAPCPDLSLRMTAERISLLGNVARYRDLMQEEEVLDSHPMGSFERRIVRRPYNNIKELKATMGCTEALAGVLDLPSEDYIERILSLSGDADMGKSMFKLEVLMLNSDKEALSGGQRAEYLFLKELENATAYDLVLIDEPESSFDNLFLNGDIKRKIQKLADYTTVFVATHNNVLGVSLEPNRIIYLASSGGKHYAYSGDATSEYVVSAAGDKKKRAEVLLDLMEAGKEAYDERKRFYEGA